MEFALLESEHSKDVVVFAISGTRKLNFMEIADYLSREPQVLMSFREILHELICAWWRGEFPELDGPTRSEVLRHIYRRRKGFVAFRVPGKPTMKRISYLPDGGVLLIRPVEVPLPNTDPTSWNDRNCSAAYDALADGWGYFQDDPIEPVVGGIGLARSVFIDWLKSRGATMLPRFWRDETNHQAQVEEARQPESKTKERRRRGPETGTATLEAADKKLFPEMQALIAGDKAKSPYGAAKLIDPSKIAGVGTLESRQRRLAKGFRPTFLANLRDKAKR
jgi:hypothetical protein